MLSFSVPSSVHQSPLGHVVRPADYLIQGFGDADDD
jgi:hypothetical protein